MGYRHDNKPPKPEDMLLRFDVRNGATMRVAFGCWYFKQEPGHDPRYHDYVGWPEPRHPDEICQMAPPSHFIPRRWPWPQEWDRHHPGPWGRYPWPAHPLMRHPEDFKPIKLEEEGYDQYAISFEEGEDATDYMTCNVGLVPEQGSNVIALKVATNFPAFHDKPKDFRFTVFARKGDDPMVTDAVCHGIITVLPGSPYPTEGD